MRNFTLTESKLEFGQKCVATNSYETLYRVIINDYLITVGVGDVVECAPSFII
jgi:hypothetical protein